MQIDTDIPIPSRAVAIRGVAWATEQTLLNLRVGDSVHVPGKDSIWASRRTHRARKDWPTLRFVTRTDKDGVRIWRKA